MINPALLLPVLLCLALSACHRHAPLRPAAADAEAREDAESFARAQALQSRIRLSATADIETEAVRTKHVDDDAADDMAIWVHPGDPGRSLVFGANKRGGVALYGLDGRERAFLASGRINNIDVMYGLSTGGRRVDIVGCTNRSDQSIDLYRIDTASLSLVDLAASALPVDRRIIDDVYGFCFYAGRKPYAFINGKNGVLQQFEILARADGRVDLGLVRQYDFGRQTEGMVADQAGGWLYIGEEDRGIWRMPAEPDMPGDPQLIPMSDTTNPSIAFDIEGLAIYRPVQGEGFLLASSQGNFSYAVFSLAPPNAYIGSFVLKSSPLIDGVEETDGIDAVAVPVGASFPSGMFAAQDGFNFDGDTLRAQNFKLVSWSKIDSLITLMRTGQ